MPSPTRWTWAWASSRSWWWTEKPGMLQSMGSQRVRLDWATELMHETIKLPSNPGYSQVHYFHLQPRAQAKATRVFKHSSKAPPPPLLLTPHPLLYSLFTVGTELCAQKSELCQDALGCVISCLTLSFSITCVTHSAPSIPSVYSILAVVHHPLHFVKRNLKSREVNVCFLRLSGSQTCSISVTNNVVKNPDVRKQYNFLNVSSYLKILAVRSKHQSL